MPAMLAGLLFALLFVLLAAGGCVKKTSDKDLSFVDPAKGESLVAGRRTLLGHTRRGAWVDPRDFVEYAKGHVPGAINVPFENVRSEYRRLQEYELLVVYGDGYQGDLAEAMSKTLMELGFKEVYTLEGGLTAWKDAGLALDTP